jgi:hypothetical protein
MAKAIQFLEPASVRGAHVHCSLTLQKDMCAPVCIVILKTEEDAATGLENATVNVPEPLVIDVPVLPVPLLKTPLSL